MMVELNYDKTRKQPHSRVVIDVAREAKSVFKKYFGIAAVGLGLTLGYVNALAKSPNEEKKVEKVEQIVLKPDMKYQFVGIPIIIKASDANGRAYKDMKVEVSDEEGNVIATALTNEKGEIRYTPQKPGKYTFSSDGASVTIEVEEMRKISLDEVQKLDAATKKYEVIESYENENSFGSSVVNVRLVEGGIVGAFVTICKVHNCYNNSHIPDKLLMVTASGEPVTFVNLATLDQVYKKITGNEIIYVKLIVEEGYSTKNGWYINLMVVPVEKPNGKIKEGIPLVRASYYKNELFGGTYKDEIFGSTGDILMISR